MIARITAAAMVLALSASAASSFELRPTKWPRCKALTDGGFDRTAQYEGKNSFVGKGCPESWDNNGEQHSASIFDSLKITSATTAVGHIHGQTCTFTTSTGTWDCH